MNTIAFQNKDLTLIFLYLNIALIKSVYYLHSLGEVYEIYEVVDSGQTRKMDHNLPYRVTIIFPAWTRFLTMVSNDESANATFVMELFMFQNHLNGHFHNPKIMDINHGKRKLIFQATSILEAQISALGSTAGFASFRFKPKINNIYRPVGFH